MSIILQEVSGEALARDPRGGARGLPDLAPDAADAGRALRAGARAPGRAHLLQVRGRKARRARTSPTRPCRRRSTARRTGVKRIATETGAGQWGSALFVRVRSCTGSSARSSWWGISYRPEAVPARDDADVRSDGPLQSVARDERRPGGVSRSTPTRSDRWGFAISEAVEARRHGSRGRLFARAPCSTTCSCTRP